MDAERTDIRVLLPVARRTTAPNNPVRPTLVFLAAFGLGLAIDFVDPAAPFAGVWPSLPVWFGLALCGAGTALTVWCLIVFDRLGTGIMPDEPAQHVVTTGPYAWSRNPMFVGFAVIHAGAAVALTSFWALVFLPVAIALTTATVILHEEAYMRRAFGVEYDRYEARVRRWIGRRRV